MDLAIGSTSSLQNVQDPTGAPPAQPKTSASSAESVAETNRQTEDSTTGRVDDAPKDKQAPRAEAAPAENRDAPPPPSDSGRGQLVDIAA